MIETLVQPTLFFCTPLIIAALGELVVERSGVVNIGIEGMMLTGALTAWCVDSTLAPQWTQDRGLAAAIACAAAMLAAMAIAIPFAIAALGFAADQIVTGTGINLLALGLTGLVSRVFHRAAQEPDHVRWIYLEMLMPILAIVLWWFFRFTRWGLEQTAMGHSPAAADAAGVPVQLRRLLAILFGATCAGLAGAFTSIMGVHEFTENMTDGTGFLALAIVIFGRWNAAGILIGGLLFGLLRAGALTLDTHPGFSRATLQLFKMFPYLVSLAALAGVAGKSGAPAALGRAYRCG